jgi:hypothetical protein
MNYSSLLETRTSRRELGSEKVFKYIYYYFISDIEEMKLISIVISRSRRAQSGSSKSYSEEMFGFSLSFSCRISIL